MFGAMSGTKEGRVGPVWDTAPRVVSVFQSSEGQVWLLVGKHGNGGLFKIVLPSFSAHSKRVSSSEMIQRLLIPSYLPTICWDGPWVSGEEVRAPSSRDYLLSWMTR